MSKPLFPNMEKNSIEPIMEKVMSLEKRPKKSVSQGINNDS